MPVPSTYLVTTRNLQSIIQSVANAKAPDRFNSKFLEDLGFKSSNDRLYIGLFKALGLLDENGVPTPRYHKFIDPTETSKVLAIAIQEAYGDLFSLRKDAYNLSIDEIKGKLKTLTQGQKSDDVINYMANTFKALCEHADWSNLSVSQFEKQESSSKQEESYIEKSNNQNRMSLHYNIQIHLPETTNMAVYDAIFQSLKKHLA